MTPVEMMGVCLWVVAETVVFPAAVEQRILRKARAIVRAITKFISKAKQERTRYPIRSVGTFWSVLSSVVMFGRFLEMNRLGHLGAVPVLACQLYLLARAQFVSASQLKKDRMALEFVYGPLPRVEAHQRAKPKPREISWEQLQAIVARQTARNGFSSLIAYFTGIRSAELLTIARLSDRPPSRRNWSPDLHAGKEEGVLFTVQGKGGLIRTILVPVSLAEKLELFRRPQPVLVRDRGVDRLSYYDIAGGSPWSGSFAKTAKRVFGESPGGHGTRHGYVAARRKVLSSAMSPGAVERLLSNELGHFRPEIVSEYYSRGAWAPRPAILPVGGSS